MILFATALLAAVVAQDLPGLGLQLDPRLDPGGDASDASGDDLVRVTLLADREAVRPGETFALGLRLAIEPGWHVYWINPGDGGLPTKAGLIAPEGITLAPVAFPGPRRFEQPGDIVNFGYEDETLLWFDARVSDELVAGTRLRFEARCSWLVCEEICLPGSGAEALELAVVSADAPASRGAHAELFARYYERLPRAFDELEGATLAWTGSEDEPTLSIRVPGPGSDATRAEQLEFFPLDGPSFRLIAQRPGAFVGGRALALVYRFRQRLSGAPWKASGVLRVVAPVSGGTSPDTVRERFYRIDHAWDGPSGAHEPGSE